MMKWFYKWLSRKIGDSSNDADDFTTRDPSGYQRINKIGSRENTFNINFITAVGGYIIQFVHYDELKDENTAIVYLITDEQDLGKEFSKIVVAEMMKR